MSYLHYGWGKIHVLNLQHRSTKTLVVLFFLLWREKSKSKSTTYYILCTTYFQMPKIRDIKPYIHENDNYIHLVELTKLATIYLSFFWWMSIINIFINFIRTFFSLSLFLWPKYLSVFRHLNTKEFLIISKRWNYLSL